MYFLLPYTSQQPEFDGEAFYEAVANLLKVRYGETNVRHFDFLINQMGMDGVPCHEVATDIYNHIRHEHTCPDCGCDTRAGNHQVLRSGSWNEPSYTCSGEHREFPPVCPE